MKWIEKTPFAVDYFRKPKVSPGIVVYFLTHMHGDHISGLQDDWQNGTLYCSETTRKLVLNRWTIEPSRIIGLPLNEPKAIALERKGKECMTVTLVDANHCPGAVMFIFEGYFGVYVHCGDFRLAEAMMSPHHVFHGLRGRVDKLFRDNT